LQVRVCIPVF